MYEKKIRAAQVFENSTLPIEFVQWDNRTEIMESVREARRNVQATEVYARVGEQTIT